MPDIGRVKYHRDGRVTVSGAPEVTVAKWKKHPTLGWEVIACSDGMCPPGINASPRSSANSYVLAWVEQMKEGE